MGEELAHRDVGLAVGRESGPVDGGRLVEIDQTALDQLLDRHRRRHYFGERGGIVDRIDGGRAAAGQNGAIPIHLAQHDLVADAHHHYGAGKVPGRDLLAHDGADGCRALGR